MSIGNDGQSFVGSITCSTNRAMLLPRDIPIYVRYTIFYCSIREPTLN